MKKSIWILCFAAVFLVTMFLLARRPARVSTEQERAVAPERSRQLRPPQVSGEPQPGDFGYREYRFQQTEMDSLWDYRRPIQFYGQVVDEMGNPVAGLRVDFSWKDISPEGTSRTQTATDVSGRFSLTGVSGKLLTIRLDDTEYNILSKPNQFGFEYANPHLPHFHVPNPNEPVIFHVQKKGESAALIKKYVSVRFSKNGQPTTVNLLTGEESNDGQFQVRVWAEDRDQRGRYDWKVSLKAIQGGFVETPEEFPSEAPPSGYDSSLEFSALASGPEWRAALEKHFYFVVGSPPQYGRMRFSAKIYGGGYFLDYFINPTGDRNLVYDPLRDVDVP